MVDLVRSKYQETALSRVAVKDVWGVGPRYAAMLNGAGIRNALELRNADDAWVRKRMTIVGLKTVLELRGVQCFPLTQTSKIKQMITVSRTFGTATDDLNEIKAAVAYFTQRAGEKLRRNKLVAGKAEVFVTTDRFKESPHYAASAALDVAPVSDSTLELLELTRRALARVYRAGFAIRKAGVVFSALELAEKAPRRLWGDEEYERCRQLMLAIDDLNEQFGNEAVQCGITLSSGAWRTRSQGRSPNYTTDWREVMMAD